MALSEDDQRRLDEIERALMDLDPDFSKSMTIGHLPRRRHWAHAAYFCIGVLLLVTGLMWTQVSLAWGVSISVVGLARVTTAHPLSL